MGEQTSVNKEYLANSLGIKGTPVVSENRSRYSVNPQATAMGFAEAMKARVMTASKDNEQLQVQKKGTRPSLQEILAAPSPVTRVEKGTPVAQVSTYSPADFYGSAGLKPNVDAHGNMLAKPITVPPLGSKPPVYQRPQNLEIRATAPAEPSLWRKVLIGAGIGTAALFVATIGTLTYLVKNDDVRNRYMDPSSPTKEYTIQSQPYNAQAHRP